VRERPVQFPPGVFRFMQVAMTTAILSSLDNFLAKRLQTALFSSAKPLSTPNQGARFQYASWRRLSLTE